MEVSQKSKAIILKREAFLENNSRVFIYSQNFGKLDLVARGTQKISSKLAGHIEPLNLCEIMIIKGKQYNYLGSALCENSFLNIKKDYAKSLITGEIIKTVDEVIKEKEKDEQIFLMLKKFLEILNNNEINDIQLILLKSTFILKLISLLGYQPNLDDFRINNIKVSENVINIMKIVLTKKFEEILKLDFEDNSIKEFENIINKYKLYIFD